MPRKLIVRARWLLALVLAPLLAGCGAVAISSTTTNVGERLTVYSSLPLQGPSSGVSAQIVKGEKLALSQAHGHVGRLQVSLDLMDDSGKSGPWSPGVTAANAKTAAEDPTTIAYIGDYDSGATAVSLPLMNAAGILQVSPASPYVGLTSSDDAGQDEPERFYPTGRRTFGRLIPGDPVQATAVAALMGQLGVDKLYVLNDEDPFQVPLAELVAGDAEHEGIEVLGNESVQTTTATEFQSQVKKIVATHPDAVFFSGGTGAGTIALWTELHEADPTLKLLSSETGLDTDFTSQIGSASDETYITTPILPARLYPRSGQRVLRQYERTFHEAAEPYALYGYEAMDVVLASIRSAGAKGDDRQAVIDRFFATKDRSSVLGRYSIDSDGDTSLDTFAVDRVSEGRPVFYRTETG